MVLRRHGRPLGQAPQSRGHSAPGLREKHCHGVSSDGKHQTVSIDALDGWEMEASGETWARQEEKREMWTGRRAPPQRSRGRSWPEAPRHQSAAGDCQQPIRG